MTSVDRIQGLSGSIAVKVPCRVATTAAITLSGEQTIDGVAVVEGDRVLVKDQADTTANGIYDVSSGAWTRTLDADGANDLRDGTQIVVARGTVNSNAVFMLVATDPVVPGTTALTFTNTESNRLTLDTEDQGPVTGGVTYTSKALGTAGVVSSGTVTPEPGDRAVQHYTNGGAHTLAPSANVGSILLDITNNASAGAITTSGFTKVVGTFATTDGYKYRCHISIGNAGSLLTIQGLQ